MLIQTLLYVGGGGALGFGYYKLVGCRSRACLLTSNPWVATIYGAVMGFMLGNGPR
ncbi:MAG: YtxH domain-containing protein [Deltaproteobacteria bacterium]|nr:YtxH domain-containing protein [Deltaproteobacteria bacterium]